MAQAFTKDVKGLFEQARKKYDNGRNLKLNEEFYISMAANIAEFLNKKRLEEEGLYQNLRPLSANFLYRKLHYDMKNDAIGIECNYDLNTLNVLAVYTIDMLFKDRFRLFDQKTENASPTIDDNTLNEFSYAMFPPDNPSYPATPTFIIDVPGFEKVYIKDESINPTGTHKDRMAYEVAKFYFKFFRTSSPDDIPVFPHLSLLTYGCAGLAIQNIFNSKHYPPLKVLVDKKLVKPDVVKALSNAGCIIYEKDLMGKQVSTEDILKITENEESGFDLTFGKGIENIKTRYYDWLSYEILNQSPDYCFVPFGSGDLMRNILKIIKKEDQVKTNRLFVKRERIRNCILLGATTKLSTSIMDKLYSPFFGENDNLAHCEQLIKEGFGGPNSGIYELEEKFAEQALEIANTNNIACEASGIAGLGLLLQLKEKFKIPNDKKIVVVNTGKLKIEKFL